MAQTRIKDLTEALSVDTDDYVVIDGATNGTRKLSADNIGGEKEYDFTSSMTPNLDSRGVTTYSYKVTPTDASAVTVANGMKIKAYLKGSTYSYPLIVTSITVTGVTYFGIYVKSIEGNVQNTSSSTITGTVHIVAPFEIDSVTSFM